MGVYKVHKKLFKRLAEKKQLNKEKRQSNIEINKNIC